MTLVSMKSKDFLKIVEQKEKEIKKKSRFYSENSPGWLYDPERKEWLKPASYEQLEIFKQQRFIEWGPAGCKPIRYIIRQRE